MLKIIIPLAGSSELFINAGFTYPKPLIEINGKPMIQWVIEQTKTINIPFQLIFIIKEDDSNKYHLDNTLKLLDVNCIVLKLKKETKGGLCTVLMAIDYIEEFDSILILNGDQVINENLSFINNYWLDKQSDVGIVTFESVHPRWSYVLIDNGFVIQTAEKNPISNKAIAGYYFFRNANDFFDNAFKTIINDCQYDGMYYISPVINEYILKNKKVDFYQIKNENYHSFYSPKLVTEFEKKYNGTRVL